MVPLSDTSPKDPLNSAFLDWAVLRRTHAVPCAANRPARTREPSVAPSPLRNAHRARVSGHPPPTHTGGCEDAEEEEQPEEAHVDGDARAAVFRLLVQWLQGGRWTQGVCLTSESQGPAHRSARNVARGNIPAAVSAC
jgi:hypothetical protein